MEYEESPKRIVHANANGPHGQVLREDVNDEYEMDRLLRDVDDVHQTLLTLYPDMEIDPNMVFEQLEVVKDNPKRVFHVVTLLSQLHRTFLNNKDHRGAFQAENEEAAVVQQVNVPPEKVDEILAVPDDEQTAVTNDGDGHPVITITINDDEPEVKDIYGGLVQDVDLIMDVFPDADPQEVYAYLEARRDDQQRVANVIEELIHRRPIEKMRADALPAQQNGPLNMDDERKRTMDVVDANIVIPSKKLRTAQKMEIEQSVQDARKTPPVMEDNNEEDVETANVAPVVEASTSSAIPVGEPSTSNLEEDLSSSQKLLSQLQVLKDTFPDADREYLSELLKSCGADETKLQATVSDMLEKREYPKLKDQLERERKQALKKEYSSRVFTPEEVLQWFEDPITFFSDNSTPVTKSYECHAYAQLYNEFPKLILNDIKKALANNNQHYTGTFHELKRKLQEECKTTKFKRRKARTNVSLPEEPDELFYKELAFTRIEEKLKDYLKAKEAARATRIEEAKAGGELLTCACCYDDENLPEEMLDCGAGHLFCRECVRRGAEVAIGDGKNGLDCMSEKCDVKFELPSLQLVLKPSTFSNLLKRIQAEEISNAEIPDLVQCPHCSFAAIMPNQEDKVFRCLNPECLKETCRFCKEPNHIPLRCDEVEKSDEVKMRTYIENKMTDALVRKCYRCSRRFMKEEGCNKMTCVCGATMCYVCRQPIKDYMHFQTGGCPQMSDTLKLHRDEILQGAEKAKQEFVEQHPELKDTQLKHDPTKDLLNGHREVHRDYDDDDAYDDYDTDPDDVSYDSEEYYLREATTEDYGDSSEEDEDESEHSLTSRSTFLIDDPVAVTPGEFPFTNHNGSATLQDMDGSIESVSQSSSVSPWPESDVGTSGIQERTGGSSFIGSDSGTSDFAMLDGDDADTSYQPDTTDFTATGTYFSADGSSSIVSDVDVSEISNGEEQSIMDQDTSLDFLDPETGTDVSHESGRYSVSSANSSDGHRSAMSDAYEDSTNDVTGDFETCSAATPSSGHGTNDYPPLLHTDNGNGSSRENSVLSPRSMSADDQEDDFRVENYWGDYSFSDSDY